VSAERWRELERFLVWAIALHSFGIGVALTLWPTWGLALGGFAVPASLFFPRQGGAFHFVVGFAYLWELRRHGTVTVLVAAKTVGTVFLLSMVFVGESAWSIGPSAAADAAMGLAAWWVHRRRLAAV
jgi:hypothetical protein